MQTIGSAETALQVAGRAFRQVPAYTQFLSTRGVREFHSVAELPLTDKQNYLVPAVYQNLLADDFDRTFTIFKSSGSSGQSFYWPQLKSADDATADTLRLFLENAFRIHERRTLAIVGLALGSWIGGEHFSWALKSVALKTPYPFSVFSPGSMHDEMLDMIRNAAPFVDQFLLVLCPSAIAHLHLKAQGRGMALPHDRLRYLVLGEPFPEALRISLQRAAGAPPHDPVILSVYGSADTGFLGAESPATAMIRRALTDSAPLARELGFPGAIPHFFHAAASDVYLETVNSELCVTRWQGIPLVRYNLHDAATFYSWEALRSAVSRACRQDSAAALYADVLDGLPALPDLIAISGRTDGCLILCGTNISETMLDEAVRAEALAPWLTGLYRAQILYEENRQYLAFELEWKQDAELSPASLDTVYGLLVQGLGRAQPEFLDDWTNVYHTWDADPARRILRLTPIRWPALSKRLEGAIKNRGIRK